MTAHVNENCIGCGLCASICSNVFVMTGEGVAAAKGAVYPEEEDQVQQAAEGCPVSAIDVEK